MNKTIGVLAVLAAGCAASEADVNRSRAVAYNTDFVTVWNAVAAEMHERYEPKQIKAEDAAAGVIVSEWKLVQVSQEGTEGVSNQRSNSTASAVRQGTFMRTLVKIEPGGPPWRLTVDCEAAEFRPNLSAMIPYKHGQADEPPWVQGRIDKLYLDVYKRLQKFAVVPGAVKAEPASNPAH